MITTMLLTSTTLVTLLLQSSLIFAAAQSATESKTSDVFEQKLYNVVTAELMASTPANINETNTDVLSNNNTLNPNIAVAQADDDDGFEQILSAQLKREKQATTLLKSKTQTGSTTNGDYDTTLAAVQPASPSLSAAPRAAAHKSLLSRKRRYLLFPEGTSFQVVYDGIVGIVDYTNYLILGITLALAWELPTKAPSEQLEDIKQQLQDGTLFLPRNDTAHNITYINTKSKKKFSQNQQKSKVQQTKPNYIDTSGSYQPLQSNYYTKPYYNYYYSKKNKHSILQPVFIPPMHRNYYYQHHNQSPYSSQTTSRRTQPGSSLKYTYDFQKQATKTSNNGRQQEANKRYYYNYNSKEQKGDLRRRNNNYNKQTSSNDAQTLHPFKTWLNSQAAYTTPYDQTKYPWWNLAQRLTNSFRRKGATKAQLARQFTNVNNARSNQEEQHQQRNQQQQQEKQSSESGYYQSNAFSIPSSLSASVSTPTLMSSFSSSSSPTPLPTASSVNAATASSIPRKHRIYPVFGKRSLPDTQQHGQPAAVIQQPQQNKQQQQNNRSHRKRRCGIDSDELSKFDRIHIRHHRRTRHTLYEKIEKYLDKRGSHGHHCVLRALCETSHKSSEQEPGSFLGELMRAVFTLPEPVEEDLQKLEYKETRYDAAHAFEGNCAKRYFHCKDSLWKSHFIA